MGLMGHKPRLAFVFLSDRKEKSKSRIIAYNVKILISKKIFFITQLGPFVSVL